MRDIATKVDSSSSLTAGEFNSTQTEAENAVTRSGQSLDSSAGPDTDLFQLARALTIHGQGAESYQDNGAANAFVLTSIQAFQQPAAYFDGMTVSFQAAATNTGACTINASGLGAVSFTRAGGSAFIAGDIVAGNIITARYFQAANRFEEVANTTPDAAGPAAPNQVAVYADAGSASQFSLTVVTGYTQPSAFTDQMVVLFKAAATNDGVGTHPVNITGLGTRNVVEKDGSDPEAGRFTADDWVMLMFREVRDAFEVAFVYDRPQPDTVISCDVSSFSGTLFNLDAAPEARPPLAYFDNMVLVFQAPQTNSGSVDINFQGIGARDLRNETGQNFESGDIQINALIIARYIASEDRFRAFVTQRRVRDLRDINSVRLDNPTTSILSRSGTVLNFGAPTEDPLGMYDAAEDSVVIPSGIDRVDIELFINTDATLGDAMQAAIQINGATRRIQTATTGNVNSNLNASLVMLDVPVAQNDLIEGQIAWVPTTGLTQNLIRAELIVRVSKFTAP